MNANQKLEEILQTLVNQGIEIVTFNSFHFIGKDLDARYITFHKDPYALDICKKLGVLYQTSDLHNGWFATINR